MGTTQTGAGCGRGGYPWLQNVHTCADRETLDFGPPGDDSGAKLRPCFSSIAADVDPDVDVDIAPAFSWAFSHAHSSLTDVVPSAPPEPLSGPGPQAKQQQTRRRLPWPPEVV